MSIIPTILRGLPFLLATACALVLRRSSPQEDLSDRFELCNAVSKPGPLFDASHPLHPIFRPRPEKMALRFVLNSEFPGELRDDEKTHAKIRDFKGAFQTAHRLAAQYFNATGGSGNPKHGFLTRARWQPKIDVFFIGDKTKSSSYLAMREDPQAPFLPDELYSPAKIIWGGPVETQEGPRGEIAMFFDAKALEVQASHFGGGREGFQLAVIDAAIHEINGHIPRVIQGEDTERIPGAELDAVCRTLEVAEWWVATTGSEQARRMLTFERDEYRLQRMDYQKSR